MSFETWAAFALASAVVLVVPGPTVIVVVACALRRGRRVALPLAGGVMLGHSTSIAVAALSLGLTLGASEALFAALQATGGAYLAWRGAILWRSAGVTAAAPGGRVDGLVRRMWLITALNPLSVAFHLAFLPRFIDVNGTLWHQVAGLGATFLLLGFLNTIAYALAAAALGRTLASRRAADLIVRAGATGLVGIGVWAALSAV